MRVGKLFEAWQVWCREQGRKEPGTHQVFGRDLAAAVPGVRVRQIREGGVQVRVYGDGLGPPRKTRGVTRCHANLVIVGSQGRSQKRRAEETNLA